MPKFYSETVHQELLSQNWDVIVIGSGLGGLTAACLLARKGKKVLVLERHSVPGGFTHTFSRKGYEWDVGVHYVGQLNNPTTLLSKVFHFVTEGKLEWAPLPKIYDRFIIGGKKYDFTAGIEDQIQNLIQAFPNEEKGIRDYYATIKKVSGSGAWFFGEKMMPFWMSHTLGYFLRKRFLKYSKQNTYEVIKQFTQDEQLVALLCAQCGNYGMSPKNSNMAIHATVSEHYVNGAAYPVGGANRIYETLMESLEKNNGLVVLKADVQSVSTVKNKVTGVVIKSGDQNYSVPCNTVISNAGARNTYFKLLPESLPSIQKMRKDLQQISASTAHLCMYVGLNASDEALNLPKNNLWVYRNAGYDEALIESKLEREADPFLLYISFPSAKDPSWPDRNPHKATLQVITSAQFDLYQEWAAFPWRKRGADYELHKETIGRKMLERMYEILPQIKGHVDHFEISTPLTTQHFSNYSRGEIYGLEHSTKRFSLQRLRPETPVKGLFITGQDVVTVGVGGAFMSGLITASRVADPLMIFKILRNKPLI